MDPLKHSLLLLLAAYLAFPWCTCVAADGCANGGTPQIAASCCDAPGHCPDSPGDPPAQDCPCQSDKTALAPTVVEANDHLQLVEIAATEYALSFPPRPGSGLKTAARTLVPPLPPPDLATLCVLRI